MLLLPNTTHLFFVSRYVKLPTSATAILTPDEVAAAARFRFSADRDRYLLGRYARRAITFSYTKSNPANLRFQTNEFGKPYLLNGGDLAFNVAHAGDYVVLAVTRGGEIGVDLEPLRAIQDRDGMAALVFSAVEQRHIQGADNPDSAFLDHWTAKEALIKGIGQGMSYPVAQVTAHFDTTPAFTRPGHDLSAWQLARGEHDGHLWALAWDGGPRTIEIFTPDAL
jgi:4'-phosphopantetheinyl transferase